MTVQPPDPNQGWTANLSNPELVNPPPPAVDTARVPALLAGSALAAIGLGALARYVSPWVMVAGALAAVYLAGWTLGAPWRSSLNRVVERIGRLGKADPQKVPLGAPSIKTVAVSPLVAVLVIASLPLVGSAVGSAASALHHANAQEVCAAVSDYSAYDANSTATYDPTWFKKLDAVGKAASSYRGPYADELNAAGKRLRSMADSGHGSSARAADDIGIVWSICEGE